jgi:AcrR family transcriptional regulator
MVSYIGDRWSFKGSMAIKQRAISDEEKMERRESILAAALGLLAEDDYGNISIASIANKAGIAKGTIFLYFRTKEELFLQLQTREYKSWFDDINNRLHALKKPASLDEFVKVFVSSVGEHPRLLPLIPILHIVLEHNIDYKTALEFKRFLLNETQTTGRLIEQCLPFLREHDGGYFLLDLQILMIGLIQSSQPAPLIEQVIKEEGLEVFEVNFEEKLQELLTLMLSGRKAIYTK